MVLCKIQMTHEKLKSENKNLLKTNCSHLLHSFRREHNSGRGMERRKRGGGAVSSCTGSTFHAHKVPPREVLVSWRSLCFLTLKWIHKEGISTTIFLNHQVGFVAYVQLYLLDFSSFFLDSSWECVECEDVVLHLRTCCFLTKGQISKWKSRRCFWRWCRLYLRALPNSEKPSPTWSVFSSWACLAILMSLVFVSKADVSQAVMSWAPLVYLQGLGWNF